MHSVYLSRRKHVDKLKSKPCIDCGFSFPPECMDFDHVTGKKSANVGKLMYSSIKRIEEEIAKCDLVCANCHRIRTKARGQYNTKRTDLNGSS